MLSFILSALKVLPQVLQLINTVMSRVEARTQRGIGYDQAVKESLEETNDLVAKAHEAEVEADKRHKSDPTDGAFDREFERK